MSSGIAVSHCKDRTACSEADIDHAGHVIATADRCKVSPHLHNKKGRDSATSDRKRREQPVLTEDDLSHLQLSKMLFHTDQNAHLGPSLFPSHRFCAEAAHAKPQTRHSKPWALSIQIQVLIRASDQYSDDGDFQPRHSMCSRWGRGRPLGQLSLAYIGSSAGQAGGLCEPGYHSASMCACCGISAPRGPCAAWRRCRGGNAVEAGGRQHHILLAVCWCPAHPGRDGYLAATFVHQEQNRSIMTN